ncbi:hypothetical protein [Raineya orbicola]|uniref:Uncharacterized protein n=1 Tax=Raineya orbicola TaxID=2016530 RepID=A0A2N3IJB7_9BACT|nr:hypothetical protein [Raineya orbicola]PKQ70409.1 hypothetical protein Rain11_0492 [Raineya orbicola]
MTQLLRRLYKEASENEKKLKDFEQAIQQEKVSEAIRYAYKGALQALKGKYSFLPAVKLNFFWEASGYLQKALAQEPENVEIIFLRFTVECGVPSLMSYALHLQEDRKKIVELLPESHLEEDFKKAIAEYLIQSGKCTFAEKKVLQEIAV